MSEQLTYEILLEASRRANWRIDDIVGGEKRLDFNKRFLPETYVRAQSLGFLNPGERLLLNHIRSRGYLAMFELLEQVIVPFMSFRSQRIRVLGRADPRRGGSIACLC